MGSKFNLNDERYHSIAEKLRRILVALPDTTNVYLVGGAVRDILLNKKPLDLDLCLEHITTEELFKSIPHLKNIDPTNGIPVFILNDNDDSYKIEITFPRTERKKNNEESNSHKNFEYIFSPKITIDEDLVRRDFTINAIAIKIKIKDNSLVVDKIVNNHGGISDLENNLLRHVSEHFKEDPLRVFRMYRFTSKGFNISDDTINFILQNKEYLSEEISKMPIERVTNEIIKNMSEKYPWKFFEHLNSIGVGSSVLPEIMQMDKIIAGPEFDKLGNKTNHTKNETVLTHSINVLKEVCKRTKDPVTRLAAFLHDYGKIYTDTDILPHHYGHENQGEIQVAKFLQRMKFSNEYIKLCTNVCKLHTNMSRLNIMRKGAMIDMIKLLYNKNIIDQVKIIVDADGFDKSHDVLFYKAIYVASKKPTEIIEHDRLLQIKPENRANALISARAHYYNSL